MLEVFDKLENDVKPCDEERVMMTAFGMFIWSAVLCVLFVEVLPGVSGRGEFDL